MVLPVALSNIACLIEKFSFLMTSRRILVLMNVVLPIHLMLLQQLYYLYFYSCTIYLLLDVGGYGDSFFTAVLQQLYGNPNYHMNIKVSGVE